MLHRRIRIFIDMCLASLRNSTIGSILHPHLRAGLSGKERMSCCRIILERLSFTRQQISIQMAFANFARPLVACAIQINF